jgi:hypothetical protein
VAFFSSTKSSRCKALAAPDLKSGAKGSAVSSPSS